MIFIIILFVLFFLFFKFGKRLFKFNSSNLTFIDGSLKSGKSLMCVYGSIIKYKKIHLMWKINTLFGSKAEEPLLYSNIPLKTNYVQLNKDLLMRDKRFREHSVVLIDEYSLCADSQLIKDSQVNENLLLFTKLFAHSTGGYLYTNSQALMDCHYALKRVITQSIFIADSIKWIPFFYICKVRSERISNENVVNVYNGVEEECKWCIIPKSYFKLYDSRTYSSLTDNLPCEDTIINGKKLKNLKTNKIISFRTWKNEKLN